MSCGSSFSVKTVVFHCSYTWVDNDVIVANVIPEGRGPPPDRPLAPIGPKIQDNSYGVKAQARTYQDLLKDDHDEDLFDYYSSSTLVSVKVRCSLVMETPYSLRKELDYPTWIN